MTSMKEIILKEVSFMYKTSPYNNIKDQIKNRTITKTKKLSFTTSLRANRNKRSQKSKNKHNKNLSLSLNLNLNVNINSVKTITNHTKREIIMIGEDTMTETEDIKEDIETRTATITKVLSNIMNIPRKKILRSRLEDKIKAVTKITTLSMCQSTLYSQTFLLIR